MAPRSRHWIWLTQSSQSCRRKRRRFHRTEVGEKLYTDLVIDPSSPRWPPSSPQYPPCLVLDWRSHVPRRRAVGGGPRLGLAIRCETPGQRGTAPV